ncbi:hypothetical protein [Nocardia bovistercoris]|uniref:Uncharacterized protein n=1 Tax=Nocardia bovistercoris TaxID=2785916 RepID=A0A931IGX2_9NOCA|nr:hypothetical protein [Nocardia bovistercoris]MBH0781344.1 hypothetical protein [Nocardia bovistercoris]
MAGWQVFLIAFFAIVLVWSVAWALVSSEPPSGPTVADIIARLNREREE